jgi:hypothetical protein
MDIMGSPILDSSGLPLQLQEQVPAFQRRRK